MEGAESKARKAAPAPAAKKADSEEEEAK